MHSKSNSDKTNKDKIYYYYLVSSIDILGQKEELKKLKGKSPKDNPQLFIEVYKQTALFVDKFRNGFKNFFYEYTKESEPSVKVVPEKMDQFKEMTKSNLKYQLFSDSIQAYVCLGTDKFHSSAVNDVFRILSTCGYMLVLSLACKKTFRAGIEVGWGIELEDGDIYGTVLYESHELESKIAEYPRIVIGDELINYLTVLANKFKQLPEQTDEDVKLCEIMAKKCLKMIAYDLDGVPILDYLCKDFLQNINNNPETAKEFEKAIRQAFEFVNSEYYEKKKQAEDRKLALRYYLLLNYFKARLKENEVNV